MRYDLLNDVRQESVHLRQKYSCFETETTDYGEEKAKENLHQGQEPLQKSVNLVITQKELAAIAGVFHDTIHKVETIEKKPGRTKATGRWILSSEH